MGRSLLFDPDLQSTFKALARGGVAFGYVLVVAQGLQITRNINTIARCPEVDRQGLTDVCLSGDGITDQGLGRPETAQDSRDQILTPGRGVPCQGQGFGQSRDRAGVICLPAAGFTQSEILAGTRPGVDARYLQHALDQSAAISEQPEIGVDLTEGRAQFRLDGRLPREPGLDAHRPPIQDFAGRNRGPPGFGRI